MKRLLGAGLGAALAIQVVWGAGLIVVDEAHWGPPQIPPPGVVPPRPLPPRPFIPPRARHFAPLEVTRHEAQARIRDFVAEVAIEQEFYNPNDQRMEGTFLFPVPKGAQLRKFSLQIDGKPAEAELLNADKARGIYEDIVRRALDPGLLEYAGKDLYRVRIFPIEPRERKRVSLAYTQLLKAEGGLVEFNYPLGAEKYSAKAIPSVSLKVELETERPLKTLYSSSHTVEIRRHGAQRATIGFEGKDLQPSTDLQLFYAAESDPVGVHLLAHRPEGDGGTFLLLLSPGLEAAADKIAPKDVVFVLDTSGSMAGPKLEQAKKALSFCVENLNEDDRFEIIRFSTETEALFGELRGAASSARGRAREFIGRMKPIGGTAIDSALQQALASRPAEGSRPFVVIFLTDGLPTVGLTQEDGIVANVKKANAQTTRVFCFGIGHDVNTHLLDKITEETRASSSYVLPEEDLELKVSSFYSRIKDPVLVNPVLRFGDRVRVTQQYPQRLPDLFRGEQLTIVGRYEGSGDVTLTLEGRLQNATRTFTHEVRFPDRSTEHEFVPRLWATRRVGYLLDEIRLHGENAELRDEVTDLARRYGIVTPYTAYLIVEDEARRGVPLAVQSLPTAPQDALARRERGDQMQELMRRRYGLGPVAQARSGQALKQAEAPASALSLSRAEGGAAVAALPSPSAAPGRPAATANAAPAQSQFAGGRSFYQNGTQWIDAGVQKLQSARKVRVQFASTDYFELSRKHPEVRPWLAIGPEVQFVLEGAIYEIYL